MVLHQKVCANQTEKAHCQANKENRFEVVCLFINNEGSVIVHRSDDFDLEYQKTVSHGQFVVREPGKHNDVLGYSLTVTQAKDNTTQQANIKILSLNSQVEQELPNKYHARK